MPKRRVLVFFDSQYLPTHQGIQQVFKSFSGDLKNDAHYEEVKLAIKEGRGFWVYASREELAESAMLSAETFINPKDAKWIIIREESNLDLTSKPPANLKDIQ